MNDKKYRIEVYEPESYAGPHPLLGMAVDVISGPERTRALLINLVKSLEADGNVCHQIVVRSRHDDPIDRVISSPSTVVIYLVKQSQVLKKDSQYAFTDIINWGIGKIIPLEKESI